MTTAARTLINDAYIMAGFKGSQETLNAYDADLGLRRLNGMLSSWATNSLFCKQISEFVGTIPAGKTFLIGPGQVIDTGSNAAPVRLEQGGFFRSGGVDYPLEIIDREQYSDVPYKATSAPWPSWIYYNAGPTTGMCYMFPALSTSAECHLWLQAPLSSFADLDSSVTLAPGYEDAITFSLAEIVGIGQVQIDPNISKQAAMLRNRIKKANLDVPDLRTGSERIGNIFAGWEN